MLSASLDSILDALHFTTDLTTPANVLLARHAADSFNFFKKSVETFEEYQRFQTDDNFAKCRYIVSFMGLPGRGVDATFGGIYEVLGRVKRGEAGFREPQGDAEVIASCSGQNYLYSLARLTQYDSLRTEWEIRWNLPGPAKYQYFKPGIPIVTLSPGDLTDSESIQSWIRQEVLLENVESVLDPDSLSFPEGAAAYVRHLKRERSTALVAYVKEEAKSADSYRCFICSFDFAKIYGIEYIECHHTVPIGAMKHGDKTKPEDCVLLCANCHRAVHKHNKWLSKAELHSILISPTNS
jgi:5-methylcytosine-specific restriction endonuclease McrA